MDIIEALQEKDNASAYRLFLELELKSAESDVFYCCFEDFLDLIHHSKSFVRVRGFAYAVRRRRGIVKIKSGRTWLNSSPN